MKKLHLVLILLGAGFLGWLVWSVGASELLRQLSMLGWGLLPFIFCEGVAEMLHTTGWRRCLSGSLRLVPWLRLFQIRLAGYAINYLTPSAGLGGEVTKATLLASKEAGTAAVSGVLADKVCFALAHLLFVTIGVPIILWRMQLPGPVWMTMAVLGGLVGGGIVTFLLLQKQGKLGSLFRWLATRKGAGPRSRKLAEQMTEVDGILKDFYRNRPGDMWRSVGWHLAGFSVGIVQTWFFFKLLNQDASIGIAASTWFLGMWFDMMTFAVPMNMGVLEGSRILAVKGVQFTAVLGLTYGIALRLAQLTWSAIGLIFYSLLASNPQPERHQEEVGVDS